MKVIINLECARGSFKWAEAYAGRLQELKVKALCTETEQLLVKSTTVSEPSKLKNKQWREEQTKDRGLKLLVELLQKKQLHTYKYTKTDLPELHTMLRHKVNVLL